MAWNDINQERRDAKNRRSLLGKILTGQATLEDVKLDHTLIAFKDFGSDPACFTCNGGIMSASEFGKLAALHKHAIIFEEVERKIDDQVHKEH